MDQQKKLELKRKIEGGSVLALTTYLKYLYNESLKKTVYNREDIRFHQSRTQTLEEIINLLPEASE